MEGADGPTPVEAGLQGSRGSADVMHTGSGRNYQIPQRFRAKRDKNRQFHSHKEAAGIREDINLNSLLAARQGLPIPFPLSPGHIGGPLSRGGVVMFPAANGHMVTKIGPYKEPLLPSGPPPLLQHQGGLNLGPLAFAHHANVKAAMHAMSMFSPTRKDLAFKAPGGLPPDSPKHPAYSVIDMHKARIPSRSESAGSVGHIHSRSESSSSVGNLCAVHDPSLKKLMKDLHRCEVSISRYQTMLNEHCDAGLRSLHQAFITLHIGLNAREKDIARELQITRQTAGTILQHRHSTACVLRQLAERAGELDASQLHELKKQIKHFVVDRKVDEEIGTTSRFIADPDDILPLVMSFGRVVNRRHVYTAWEGDPAAAIERSKHANRSSVFSSPTSSAPTTPSPTDTDENIAAVNKSSSQESLDQKLEDDSVFTTPEHENSGTADISVAGGGGRGSLDTQTADDLEDHLEREQVKTSTEEVEEVASDSVRATSLGESRCSDVSPSDCHEAEKTTTVEDDADSSMSPLALPISPSSPVACFDSKATAGLSSVADSGTAKPPSSVTASHKGRSPFSRKFAAPIVVTHTRRPFTKPLPKNLDPKSTVTLLLSSTSAQQKNKHKNPKSFKRQFSPSYHSSEAAAATAEENIVGNASSPRDSLSRLRGREKERELWRKRFSSSSNWYREQGRSSESGEEGGGKVKRSPEELSAIQSRVRESLRAQGVFLYDPVTGAVPVDTKREESVDSGVGKSEPNHNFTKMDLKKKTPTQLRRERKKRQKERERRQKELERRTHEEGGGEKRGRGSILEKTSANPSTSTSRTASPLSSIDNNTSDTPLESVSLSLSQSPLPPADDDSGEPAGNKSRGERGGGKEDGNTQSGKGDSVPTCNLISTTDTTADNKMTCTTVNLISTTETTADNKTTHENQQQERQAVDSPVHAHVPSVTKMEEPSTPPKMPPSDSASIEWDVSQMRQEGIAVDDSHLSQAPGARGKGASSQMQNGYTEMANNDEVLPSHHSTTPLENNFSTGAGRSCKSSSSPSLLNLVRNGVLPHRTANSLSTTTPPHLCNGPPSSVSGSPLSSSPSTILSSSAHSNDKTEPFVRNSPSTSDDHVLETQLTGKRFVSRLQQNGDTAQSIVIDGHEE